MRGFWLGLLAVAGCFAPNPPLGLECAQPGDLCPDGQHCLSGICVAGDTEADAPPEPIDAPPTIDAEKTIDAPEDPSIDARLPDGPPTAPDAAPITCPAGYVALTGGTPGHKYRVISTTATWFLQGADCDDDGTSTYLAIPDDQTEHSALIAATATGRTWVGLTDALVDGEWRTVAGAPAAFLPWGAGQPDNFSGNEDCGEGRGVGYPDDLNDLPCTLNRPAVCECGAP